MADLPPKKSEASPKAGLISSIIDDRPYDVTIAIDFGTHGTACSVYFGDGKGKDLETQLGELTFLKPGEGVGSGGKQLTALFLEAAAPHRFLAFGQNAREKYADSCDSKKMDNALYFHTFKLYLAPKATTASNIDFFSVMVPAVAQTKANMRSGSGGGPDGGTGSSGSSSATSRSGTASAGAGSSGDDDDPIPASSSSTSTSSSSSSRHSSRVLPSLPALLLVTRTLAYVKDECFRFLSSRMRSQDVPSLRIRWALTVPAIWNDEAKAFMRKAAIDAGLVTGDNEEDLMFSLEPEAAIIASIADCAPSTRSRFVKGAKLMVVDCGGGTVDITTCQIVEPASPGPLAIRELLGASGGMWGATNVDKAFSAFLRDLLTPQYHSLCDSRTLLETMACWEAEKTSISGESIETDTIRIKLGDCVTDLSDKTDETFGKETLKQLIASYNERHGLSDDAPEGSDTEALSWERGNKVVLPPHLVRGFFKPILKRITDHVESLLQELNGGNGGHVDCMVVAGGFAESSILQNTLRSRFQTDRTAVILPRRPGKVVVMGAALFALQPRAIKERVMKFSYGYLGAEPYNPALHSEGHRFLTSEGRELVHVLYPLVQKGDRVPMGHRFHREGLIPVRSDQTVIEFELFRTDQQICDPRKGPKRTIVVERTSHGTSGFSEVLKSDRVACLTITIGETDKPREKRGVDFEMRFDSTEIRAAARSSITGEVKEVKIRYEF